MSNEESKVFWIFIIPITWFCFFGIGWCIGNDVTVKSTRQTLCREFITETNNYINCNTKSLDEVIKLIKGVNQCQK